MIYMTVKLLALFQSIFVMSQCKEELWCFHSVVCFGEEQTCHFSFDILTYIYSSLDQLYNVRLLENIVLPSLCFVPVPFNSLQEYFTVNCNCKLWNGLVNFYRIKTKVNFTHLFK